MEILEDSFAINTLSKIASKTIAKDSTAKSLLLTQLIDLIVMTNVPIIFDARRLPVPSMGPTFSPLNRVMPDNSRNFCDYNIQQAFRMALVPERLTKNKVMLIGENRLRRVRVKNKSRHDFFIWVHSTTMNSISRKLPDRSS